MRLCHPPDGSTSPKYKLLCFITAKFFFCKEKNAIAFNRDRCCHLVLCLQLIPFHCLNFLKCAVPLVAPFGGRLAGQKWHYLGTSQAEEPTYLSQKTLRVLKKVFFFFFDEMSSRLNDLEPRNSAWQLFKLGFTKKLKNFRLTQSKKFSLIFSQVDTVSYFHFADPYTTLF